MKKFAGRVRLTRNGLGLHCRLRLATGAEAYSLTALGLLAPRGSVQVWLEGLSLMNSLTSVTWLKTAVAMVLLAIWMPATMCCALERAGVPFFDNCCADETSHDNSKAPCTDKSCCLLDAGRYTAQITPPIALLPLDALALVPWALVDTPQRPQPDSYSSGLAPPELPVTWQFSFRAALPPRAPSIIS